MLPGMVKLNGTLVERIGMDGWRCVFGALKLMKFKFKCIYKKKRFKKSFNPSFPNFRESKALQQSRPVNQFQKWMLYLKQLFIFQCWFPGTNMSMLISLVAPCKWWFRRRSRAYRQGDSMDIAGCVFHTVFFSRRKSWWIQLVTHETHRIS